MAERAEESGEVEGTFTVEEARRYYGLGRNSMYAAIKRGDIPSLRIGRRILVPKSAVKRQLGGDAA